MKFKKAVYENFGPFSEAELTLNDIGLVLVQGDNQVNSSADSNGAGKSFLLEGLVYALFGRTLRGIVADEVIRDHHKGGKNCCVSVVIDNSGQEIEIKRYRKHKVGKNTVQVFVDGVDRTLGTNKETDNFICELLGLDYNTFTRSVYFDGSKIVPFPTLTDKEIKETFEKVLGLEDLTKVSDVVRRRLSGVRSQASAIESEIAIYRSQVSTAEVEILNAKSNVERWQEDLKRQIEAKEEQLKEGQSAGVAQEADFDAKKAAIALREQEARELVQRFAGLDDARNLLSKSETALAQKKSEISIELSQCLATANSGAIRPPRELEQQDSALTFDKSQALQALSAAMHTLNNAETKIGKPCGECGKPYEHADLSSIIEHAKRHKEAAEQKIAEVESSIAALKQEITAYVEGERSKMLDRSKELQQRLATEFLESEAMLQTQKAQLNDAIGKRAEASAKLATFANEYATLEREREQNRRIQASLNALANEIEALRKQTNPYLVEVQRWEQRKAEADGEIKARSSGLEALRRQTSVLNFLEKAYGRAGLKAHILETITPVLNQRANEYALRLADGTVGIEFSTVTQNKDGTVAERFSVNVTNGHGSEGYLANSSGERKKIDLAIALALSDLVSARSTKPIDLFVCDEVAESLDPTALERVVELLNDKAKERGSILVISHSDMKAWIPNAITVEKTASGSRLAA